MRISYGWILTPILVIGLATACGGSSGKSSSSSHTPSASSSAAASSASSSAATTAITQNWEAFFSKSTSVPQKIALLQNGQSMQATVNAFARDPRMSQTTAKVTSVQPSGSTATVHYQVLVGNQVMLPDATGTAVLENGTWKVSDQTLCGLLTLAAPGQKVPGCGG